MTIERLIVNYCVIPFLFGLSLFFQDKLRKIYGKAEDREFFDSQVGAKKLKYFYKA